MRPGPSSSEPDEVRCTSMEHNKADEKSSQKNNGLDLRIDGLLGGLQRRKDVEVSQARKPRRVARQHGGLIS